MECERQGCTEPSAVIIKEINTRRCEVARHACAQHAREFYEASSAEPRTGRMRLGNDPFMREFDVALLSCDMATGFWWVVLREVGGDRRISIKTGPCEGAALDWQIRARGSSDRPFTHDVLLRVVQALGGTVQGVVVDDVSDDVERTYFAKLRISNGTGLVDIDSRPSDAFTLAVVCDAPIFVADRVLAKAYE